MILKAYNFFIPKRNNDLHGTLFSTLTLAGVKDFVPENPNRSKVQLATDGFNIICRASTQPNHPIASREEVLEVNAGDTVRGIVTLSSYKQCAFTKEETEEFKRKHNRMPTSTESHPYKMLNDDEFRDLYTKLLANAGLEITRHVVNPNPVGAFKMAKAKKFFKALDVAFEAKVTDLEKLEFVWFNGIGRVKTYGFGMIRIQVV